MIMDYVKLRKKVNTLQNENETLKNMLKEELYSAFMDKLGEPEKVKKLQKDNKKLRNQVKQLKEEILKNETVRKTKGTL